MFELTRAGASRWNFVCGAIDSGVCSSVKGAVRNIIGVSVVDASVLHSIEADLRETHADGGLAVESW